ncbi:MAG TPA: ATP-dependent zinc metalloprotease FtsH [Bacteriovoracaceae bacterium]|nr:ATP-dependent zinc metalloprotease FtsH [Bacteriovoracaceae bacterium]
MEKEPVKNPPRLKLFPIMLALLSILFFRGLMQDAKTDSLSYSTYKAHLKNGNIESVTLIGDRIRGVFKRPIDGKKEFETVAVAPEVSKELDASGVKYQSLGDTSGLTNFLAFLLPTFLLIGFWYFMLRRGLKNMGNSGGFMSIGKSKAKIYVETDTKTTFKDVAGADEALEELREIIDFLKNAEKVKSLGGKMPKGILLVGAPGTGKTLIAKAMAGEAGVPFFSANGSEFVEMFVGVGAARVRDLFNEAKKSSPCVIFIDELDAMGKARQSNSYGGGNDEKEQTLNQLLVEMDGFDTQGGIIIIAATNRPEMIDPALLRAGRFDRQVVVDRPDRTGRRDILSIHARKTKIDPGVELDELAALTPGFSGADLANLVNEAALIATRNNAPSITMDHFTLALERAIAGLEKKNRLINPKEREVVAFHEMGHALVGYSLSKDEKIHKVSIIPHGIGSMGYTIQRPTEDRYIMTQKELENKMAVLMGGRASEMLIFRELSTGASDDLAKATNIAREMIMRYGMSMELGFVAYEEAPSAFLGPKAIMPRNSFAEETAKKIDETVRELVMQAYKTAYEFLQDNQEVLNQAAHELLDRETLNESDLMKFFNQLDGSEKFNPTSHKPLYEGGSAPLNSIHLLKVPLY